MEVVLHFFSVLCIIASVLGGWSEWTVPTERQFGGQYGEFGGLVSDPSIIRDGDTYRMFYTCWDPPAVPADGDGNVLMCQATSVDGINWTNINTLGGRYNTVEGVVVNNRPGQWDENLEACFVVVDESETVEGARYLLYYSGYENEGTPAKGFPADLALAYSTDGETFTRFNGGNAVVTRSAGWYDNDAVYSPTILLNPQNASEVFMIYAAHCYSNCSEAYGIFLLGATSTDYVNWTKLSHPIITYGANSPFWWMVNGVAEPGWIYGPDEYYYLFYTGGFGEEPVEKKVIGVARSNKPFSGYEPSDMSSFNPNPIIVGGPNGTYSEAGVLAPSVLLDNGMVKSWHIMLNWPNNFNIGYATTTWPLYTDDATTSITSTEVPSSSFTSSSTSDSTSEEGEASLGALKVPFGIILSVFISLLLMH